MAWSHLGGSRHRAGVGTEMGVQGLPQPTLVRIKACAQSERNEGVEEGDALPVLGELQLDKCPRPSQVPLYATMTPSCLSFHLQHDEHRVPVPPPVDGAYTQRWEGEHSGVLIGIKPSGVGALCFLAAGTRGCVVCGPSMRTGTQEPLSLQAQGTAWCWHCTTTRRCTLGT